MSATQPCAINEAGHRVEHGRELRLTIVAWTSLPTYVGIGLMKTLAKLANRLAKKNPGSTAFAT